MPFSDSATTVHELMQLVRGFSQQRDWEQFHHPKDLGVALAIEVGEILEHFRYLNDRQIADRLMDEKKRKELAYEMADVFWLLLRMADVCGVDLSASLEEKVELAAQKYPVEKVRGRPDKYTEYRDPSASN